MADDSAITVCEHPIWVLDEILVLDELYMKALLALLAWPRCKAPASAKSVAS